MNIHDHTMTLPLADGSDDRLEKGKPGCTCVDAICPHLLHCLVSALPDGSSGVEFAKVLTYLVPDQLKRHC